MKSRNRLSIGGSIADENKNDQDRSFFQKEKLTLPDNDFNLTTDFFARISRIPGTLVETIKQSRRRVEDQALRL